MSELLNSSNLTGFRRAGLEAFVEKQGIALESERTKAKSRRELARKLAALKAEQDQAAADLAEKERRYNEWFRAQQLPREEYEAALGRHKWLGGQISAITRQIEPLGDCPEVAALREEWTANHTRWLGAIHLKVNGPALIRRVEFGCEHPMPVPGPEEQGRRERALLQLKSDYQSALKNEPVFAAREAELDALILKAQAA